MVICLKVLVILDYGGGVWTGSYHLVVIYNQMLLYSVIMAEENVEDNSLIVSTILSTAFTAATVFVGLSVVAG